MGNKEDAEYQKAYYAGKVWYQNGRKYEIRSANDNFAKARVYVDSPEDVPEGRSAKRGVRGKLYYLTTLKQQTAHKKKKGKPGGGQPEDMDTEGEHSAPEAPGIEGAKTTVKVTGNGVGIVAGVVNGKLVAQSLKNAETAEFIKKVMGCSGGPKDPAKVIQCMKKVAEDEGLEVSG